MKIYAVKEGRKTGLFSTWDECKAQVDKHPGAKYKSFKSEAEAIAYLEGTETASKSKAVTNETIASNIDGHLSDTSCVAYVDGSFNNDIGCYGWGLVFISIHGEEQSFGGGINTELAAMRNVAGEILGAKMAISRAEKLGMEELHLFYDYEGIEKWATGAWKTNKMSTREYAEFCKNTNLKLVFHKVAAHTGDYYNEIADQLAKNGAGVTK